ncbi:sensor domain-containing diguanylate cyclase [Leptolyngbya sp. FACHB-671]|uniref:GGDEF domain-containing protein n=1 Tax=Leptolyngbya sp. FACHB-671 TaxID=2692812 RepID=UPI001682A561|nr:sensor domain-containing diguanylate cyclase [Leptolyngbya sp. FACHB-671]MBD1869120.1 sensor domain-containing diguanylate cyclase [Cyanobacteria bacterium FACHB-471]MBD2067585.1 sensor domain-containing diguanylate cyclase [Leptolyngbya sp. FACHB-671]
MSTQSTWKQIYPSIKTAVAYLESIDLLLTQAVRTLAAFYQTDCLLWAGLETENPDSFQVYATSGARHFVTGRAVQQSLSPTELVLKDDLSSNDSFPAVWQIYPETLPEWLVTQQRLPQVTQLETGELIVPATHNGRLSADFTGSFSVGAVATSADSVRSLQLVLLLNRPLPSQATEAISKTDPAAPASPQGWSLAEVESLEVICSQLGLAYSALYWQQRLEQARRQASLVGRIVRLLNSNLNPDEIVGRIVAELGQGLNCDRCILIDLRSTPPSILAAWEHPDQQLPPLERQVDLARWQSVVDIFIQDGVSYLEVEQDGVNPDPLQDWLHTIGAVSALIVPLFIQAEFFGAVSLLSYQSDRVYQLDELQTIRQVTDQAAIALTNAQHYQSLWHKQEALRMQNNSVQLEIVRDDLTQLMNRRSLERELEQFSTKAVWAVQENFCVIILDIDYFKLVNDTYGHSVGDEVLQHLAQRLQRQLRKETAIYRYDGEEFVVLLAETTLTEAVDVAERLRQAIRAAPMKTSAGEISITASFGIAQQNSAHDRNAWDVLQRANRALDHAKRQGRDRVKTL